MAMVSMEELQELARGATGVKGDPLSPCDAALIRYGVAASVTSLNRDAIAKATAEALAAGATPGQVQEILALVSGLGVHSLMASCTALVEQASVAGCPFSDALTSEQQALWDRHVGNDPFWAGVERELPGFLRAMLQINTDQFEAFFTYCAVPWKDRLVRARIKELAAMACDVTPVHRFAPGFRLHLANAVALGAGRLAIEETLAIAAAAPLHQGTH